MLTMEKRQIAAIRIKKRKRNNRLHWVHPILTKRVEFVAFYTLLPKLRQHEDKFSNYFRMSTTSFDELHLKLNDSIQRQDTFMRECIQPVQMYLASGCSFVDLHYTFLLGVSTISKIVRGVCCAIWSVLRLECIPEPDKDKWKSIAQKFETRANFPNCIGAVDGKHVRIVHHLNSMHINYKEYSSLVLMAVADADYRFVYANIGSYGKDCDSNVFQKCQLWRSIVNGTMDIRVSLI
ncbi:protein ALP1-like [Aphis craccivora]|uniref:Protein ALP1-like n=1 Tax=Aphis craccivora TaxID=307492 RepID=A0A6G0W0G1_APHCR|nr:protein ALP1-like [Aphis craccivora]